MRYYYYCILKYRKFIEAFPCALFTCWFVALGDFMVIAGFMYEECEAFLYFYLNHEKNKGD